MTLRLRADVSMVDDAGSAVLLDEHTGRYFQLNSTGATVVRGLLQGHSVDDTARQLAERYPVAADRALADVISILDQLADARLVDR
jgi:hypothetical protein